MKILNVVQVYYPSVGGTQIFFKNINEYCVKNFQDEVEVFTVDSWFGPNKNVYKKIEPAKEMINGVLLNRFSFLRFQRKPLMFLKKLLSLFFKTDKLFLLPLTGPWSPQLIKAIKNSDADVIVGAAAGYMHMTYSLWRNKTKNPKPFVAQGALHFFYNTNEPPIFGKSLKAMQSADCCILNTEFEKQKLIELGVDKNKIVVTGSAVDVNKFLDRDSCVIRKKFSLNKSDILVGYIGRIEKYKNVVVLLQAFANAFQQNKNLRLLIAGLKSQYAEELKASVSDADFAMQNQIFFLEDFSEEEKPFIYNALDIFALPSVNESFGMVFLEAWCCKKPVIGTNVGAIASVISDNVDGFLFEPFNEKDLSEKILLLANDEIKRRQMGEAGFNKVQQNYTWEIVTEKYRKACHIAIQNFKLRNSA